MDRLGRQANMTQHRNARLNKGGDRGHHRGIAPLHLDGIGPGFL